MEDLYVDALDAAAARGWGHWLFAFVRGLADVVEQAHRLRSMHRNAPHAPYNRNATMSSTVQDLRFAVRSLLKAPGFTFVAALTLAVGIGANTAIFSLVNAALLRAPAFVSEPDRMVSIYTSDFSGPLHSMSSYMDFEDYRAGAPALDDAVLVSPGITNVAGDDGVSDILVTEFVTGNYFDVLGVRPALGRGFTEEEGDYTSGATVAVLSHGLWTRAFGADPAVLGKTLHASGQTLTVIGVAPDGFGGSLPVVTPELWVPISVQALIQGAQVFQGRGQRGSMIRARLAAGATMEQAQSQLETVAARLHEEAPRVWSDVNGAARRITVTPDGPLPPQFKGPVTGFAALLLTVVGIVLLIACANVANLSLARGAARSREIAVRVALGAGRAHIVRQLLAESVLIGVAGGAAGAALAAYLLDLASRVRPMTGVAVSLDLGLDTTVLLFSLLLTMLTVIAVGLVPALRSSRPDLVPALKQGRGAGSGRLGRVDLRSALVVSQVSASLLLLVGAGLFLKSLRSAVSVDPGFAIQGIATASLSLGPEGYSVQESMDFFAGLEERIRARPEVQATSLVDALPMTLAAGRRGGISVPGYEPAEGEDMEFQFLTVGPGFVGAMGMRLVSGREFTTEDRVGAPATVMVNETFAQHFWPGRDALGQLVNSNGVDDAQVVGVVADAMYRSLSDEGRPAFFLPLAQRPTDEMTLIARVPDGREADFLTTLRSEIGALDPTLPISSLQTMEQAVAGTLLPQRTASWLLTIAGGLGLLLATVGLYGVMAFLVSQRTREVGVRMALGARHGQVVAMVVRRGLALAGVGALVGVGMAAALTRFLSSFLFGVSPTDPAVLVLMTSVALLLAGFASWVPARRAARVHPMEALRHD